jgi:CheY-like chemotaxis protein
MNILLVDDDSEVREVVVQMLQILGHSVVEAQNGLEALRLVHQGFDLQIVDLSMPVMDGFEYISNINKLGIVIPTIIASGFVDPKIEGCIITKPYGLKTLNETIKKVL